MTKLRISLSEGIIEVEGEEGFVTQVYNDYKDKLNSSDLPHKASEDKKSYPKSPSSPLVIPAQGKRVKDSPKRKESYTFVKDLNLSATDDHESLRDFYSEMSPSSAMERNSVFVYYLQKKLLVENIGLNHIYTCYKNVDEKVPLALKQSLLDTASRKGWIDTSSLENITVTTHGENLIEHDLGKRDKDEKKK